MKYGYNICHLPKLLNEICPKIYLRHWKDAKFLSYLLVSQSDTAQLQLEGAENPTPRCQTGRHGDFYRPKVRLLVSHEKSIWGTLYFDEWSICIQFLEISIRKEIQIYLHSRGKGNTSVCEMWATWRLEGIL